MMGINPHKLSLSSIIPGLTVLPNARHIILKTL